MAKAKTKTKTPARPPLKLFFRNHKKGSTETFEIELDDKTVSTKAGSSGSSKKREKSQSFARPEKAQSKYDELLAAKRDEGYRALGEVDKPTVPIVRDEELEAAIRENREDAGPYLVYADWLQAQGSPVGEMIVFAQRKKQKQAAAIAKKLGLPVADMATFGWRFGLWQWMRLENGLDGMETSWDPIEFVRALFGSPLCLALEELRIGILRWDYNDQADVIIEAGRHGWAKDLQKLRVGDVDEDIDMNHHTIGDVGKAITKSFPNLVSLKLQSGSEMGRNDDKLSFGITGLDLPELKDLVIETCAMTSKRMKAFTAAAKLPALEKLELWFGAVERGADAKIADIAPVFDGKKFPKLRHLGLRNTERVTDIVRVLPGSKSAKQLVTLDLSLGTMSDEDAAELAEGAAKLSSLKELHVGRSYVTAAGVRTLKAAFKGVKVTNEKPREIYEGGSRYVSVEE